MGFKVYLKKALPFVRFIIKDELQRNKIQRLLSSQVGVEKNDTKYACN